jgi:excisionase family DNA binding protein
MGCEYGDRDRTRDAGEYRTQANRCEMSDDDDVALEHWCGRMTSSDPRPEREERRVQHRAREFVERPRTVAQAAAELGLSVHTVRAWVAGRRLGHIRLGRAIRIPEAEIRRIIQANTVPAAKER